VHAPGDARDQAAGHVRQRRNPRVEQVLGKDADFGMGLGIHGSPSLTDHRAGRDEPISSDQAVTTAGTVVNRL